ncbi:hypothetical protein BGG37_06850 [Campylobacter lari]|nr:hypothetical protein [Campylobacter lari]
MEENISLQLSKLINYFKIDEDSISYNSNLQHIEIRNSTINQFEFKLFNTYKLSFVDCIFDCEIRDTTGSLRIKNKIFIHNCVFKKNLILFNVQFENITYIAHCRFESNCHFDANTFYDFSNFERNIYNYVTFEKSIFLKNVTFYNSKFNSLNFSQVIFNDNSDFVNLKVNFDFKKLKNIINSQLDFKNSSHIIKVDCLEFANDFRDSFRILKNILIKDNNLLDASKFHKYELYCKEIELENKKDKTLKDKIDKWQLSFYRKLCDHHTDLLLNLKWLVVLIGSFALLYFTSRVIQDINLLKVLNQYGVCLSIAGVFILFCLYWFGCIKKFDFFVYFNLIAVLWVICYKPKIIFGIVNLIDSNSYNGFENALITIYTILLALVLFSLQKTARKNSIVPS